MGDGRARRLLHGVSQCARPGRVRLGSRVAYTLTVTNHGPDRATRVVVRERLPGQLTLISSRPSHGVTCTGRRTIVCRFSSLGVSKRVQVVITVQAVHTGRVRSTARVAGAETDPVPGNDTATASVSIIPRPHPRFTG